MDEKETKEMDNTLTNAHLSFEKKLTAHAFFKIHSHTLSKDLVQDTFLKTWRYLVRGGKIEIMRAFLYHVLNDLIIDEYRKKKTVSLDVLIENGFEPSYRDKNQKIEMLEGKSAILLIGSLPEKYQKVMKMKYVQDLSLKQISMLTGLSKNTIAVQIHRGLAKLKVLYKPL